VHEIKLDGYRMAARIDNGRVQLLTRTGLDWTLNIQAPSPRWRA
jgi:bifunctional non-homologous end joining protein LigD